MNAQSQIKKGFFKPLPTKLPSLSTAADCLKEVLEDFNPEQRLSVSESAAKYRRIDSLAYKGPWDNSHAPYMCEPQDTATSRMYNAGVFIGPARSNKTSAFIENVAAHFIKTSPRTMRIFGATQALAGELSKDKIAAMLRASPELKAMQKTGRGSDNLYEKLFRGGVRLDIGWPVIGKLSQADIPVVLFSDFDRIKNMDVDGEGDPWTLGQMRTLTFGSLGWTGLECSPGYEISNADWYPASPHEAPPTKGGLGHYNNGTRGRFYWHCPHCNERFEPDYPLIQFDMDVEKPISDRAATAVMICPHNGCLIVDADKRHLNQNGVWLHEARDTDNGGLCLLSEEDRIVKSTTASWWLKGPPASFQSMVKIVTKMLEAESEFERTNSEVALKAATNTTLGLPYLSRIQENESELNAGALWNRANERELDILPPWTRYFAYHVDVQDNRFVVQATAVGPGMESAIVSRFDLFIPPMDAPNGGLNSDGKPSRQLRPPHYLEDWMVLEHLESRALPVEGAEYALRPMGVTVDSVGSAGVTDKARKFWRKMKRRNLHMRFHLVQGVTRDYGNRVDRRYPEIKTKDRNKKNTRRKSDVPIAFMVSNKLRDEVAAGLLREADGPGRLHMTKALGRTVFDEICAEERIDAEWKIKSGVKRNEAFDLAYHAKAFGILMGAEEVDWNNPKESWFLEGPENAMAIPLNEAPKVDEIDPTQTGSASNRTIETKPVKPKMTRAEQIAAYVKMRTR